MPWFVTLGVISVLVGTALLVSPVLLLGVAAIIGYRLYQNNPDRKEGEKGQLTLELYEETLKRHKPRSVTWNCPEPFIPIADALISEVMVGKEVPEPPPIANSIEGARYRDRLMRMSGIDDETLEEAKKSVETSIEPFVRIYEDAIYESDGQSDALVPIEYFIKEPHEEVHECMVHIFRNENFKELHRTLDANRARASKGREDIYAYEYPKDDVVDVYLADTPLRKLFDVRVPFAIPEKYRTEHHFILGGTGHGKSQTMQYYIAKDIEKAIAGEMSLIVIDSQGDLIENIRNLKGLEPHNTVIIDPEDIDFPVCLNLFDIKSERLNSYSPLARERQLNGIIELYDYILGSLLAAEMTQKQTVIFRYVTRLLLLVPNATIHTMLDLFQDGAMERYEEYIDQLDEVAQLFFRTEFAGREFVQTRRQVTRRLYGILENQAFTRMFSNPESKLDLFSEMNYGKVILINTSKSLLKEEGTQIFGRFFIAMITQAAQEREELGHGDRMPCMVYIDEANDYGFDEKIDLILTQARKYNVGLVMATQYLDKISPKLQSAIAANTAIKFAGGASNRDAKRMAPDMRCTAEFIEAQPTLTFAAYVRGLTPKAIPLSFTPGYLEKLPKASQEELDCLLAENRAKYAEPARAEPEPEAESPEDDTPPPEPEPVEGEGFVMAESVPEEERMAKPKRKAKGEDVPEKGEW